MNYARNQSEALAINNLNRIVDEEIKGTKFQRNRHVTQFVRNVVNAAVIEMKKEMPEPQPTVSQAMEEGASPAEIISGRLKAEGKDLPEPPQYERGN